MSKNKRFLKNTSRDELLPKGGGKRGHIVAETLLLMTFPCTRKLGNICCGHKMFLNKIRNIFLCPEQILRARANGETFVSATMRLSSVTMCHFQPSQTQSPGGSP